MIKGALHVHSIYSDGEFTLPELRNILLAEGCSFVCMTDHAEYFDERTIQTYMQDLERNSDSLFRFVMGLEYNCERRMHILGYGASAPANTEDPQSVIGHIASQGAISVIAHPKDEFFPWIETFTTLPQGIETWNSKYDGRYAPRPATFALLRRLQLRAPGMHAFYGQDLHWKKQFRGLFVNIDTDSSETQTILQALAEGKYTGHKGNLRLPASGALPETLLLDFERRHSRSHNMRRLMKNGKQVLDRLGIRIPDSLKSLVRKVF